MSESNYSEVLNSVYKSALKRFTDGTTVKIQDDVVAWLDYIVENAEGNKGILAVLVTLTLYKIVHPEQDIRIHQAQLPGGFSGRSIDSKYVTPFLKEHQFPAMAESGWLTRSLEQPYPYELNYQGKIRPQKIKEAFLYSVDAIQTRKFNVSRVLEYLFLRLIASRDSKRIILAKPQRLPIAKIIKLLESHFTAKYSGSGASRLPVLAVYAAYQCMMDEVVRFKGKTLCQLESHNSSDRQSGRIGDIDVVSENDIPFEGVEIKHEIKITPQMVGDAYEKFKGVATERYYLLTTANMDSVDIDEIEKVVEWIGNVHGCQVIVNGVYSTLRYYLRLLSNPAEFIDKYVELLQSDESIKYQHKTMWNTLVDKLSV